MKMRLEVTNFAKIKSADIKIDGITVIAGDNNTGKSTVGKILYSIFNSVYDIANKIEKSRKTEINSRCRGMIRNSIIKNDKGGEWESNIRSSRNVESITREITRNLMEADLSFIDESEIKKIFINAVEKTNLSFNDDSVDEFVHKMLEIVELVNNTEDYTIAVELIDRYFNSVFYNQIDNLSNKKPAEVNLTIKDKQINFVFSENQCKSWKTNIELLHEAFFVDDPFILDNLGSMYFDEKSTRSFLVDKMEATRITENDNVVNSIWAKEKLKEISEIINKVVPGRIENTNGEWTLSSETYVEPIRFDNISAGLKSFVLLKIMLEKGILKEKDILILDEPEIHLHPEWQIRYAEIIVLLQREFELSVVVTTHSRDFFEAIELFAKKYNIINKCNFYLSRQVENRVEFDDVSDDISTIYKHLVSPSRLLDKIKFELEENEDE